MSKRGVLLAMMSAAIVSSSCAAVVDDDGFGSTLPPLRSEPLDGGEGRPTTPDSGADEPPSSEGSPTTVSEITTSSTSTTTTSTTTTSTTTTSSTTTSSPTSTTIAPAPGLAGGVSAMIDGRSLDFSRACRSGANLTLDGVTWAFAGNSFRLSGGEDDIRSEAELIGDGWTMPMLVASVRSGVYTYVGRPVEGSVRSAEVVIDFGVLDFC